MRPDYGSTGVATTGTVRSTSSTTPTRRVRHPSVSILVNATFSPRRPTTKTSQCWCLVVRRSTFDANIVPYAIRYRKRVASRARNRVGDKNSVELTTSDKLSRRLITFAEQFENPVIRMEDLEGIRENSSWSGVRRGISTNSNSSSPTKPNALVFVSTSLTLIIPASNVRRAVQ